MNVSARQQVAMAFGPVPRTARDDAGLPQEQLPEVADVDRTYLSLLERAPRQPTLHMLLRLVVQSIWDWVGSQRNADSSASGMKSAEFLWEPKLTSYTVRAVDGK
jgi:hypothetical protein